MIARHQVSRAAILLIKRFEGFRAKAAELDDGRWTIGYGHTRTARAGTEVAEADAEALLLYDLINVAHAVNEWTYAPLNQNQFDALVSFAFNIGLENFRRSTTLRRINEGRILEAAMAMELWRRADFDGERIVIDALVRRRAFEKSLFLKPVDAWAPAPSPVLPPKIDYDVAPFTLTGAPAVLRADMEGARAIAHRAAPAPFVPLEDSGPTASEAAAAAVSARLGALLRESEDQPKVPAPPVEDAAQAPATETQAEAAGQPLPEDEPAPEEMAEAASAEIAPTAKAPTELARWDMLIEAEGQEVPRDIDVVSTDPKPVVTDEVAAPRPAEPLFTPRTAAAKTAAQRTAARRQPVSILVWVALGLLGLALFVSAVKFGFRTLLADSLGGLDPLVTGLGLGIVGIGCTAAAVYQLLMRLAGPTTPSKG
ncbi:MAG TPA: lysozyme [Caulobacteraceae bacterium]